MCIHSCSLIIAFGLEIYRYLVKLGLYRQGGNKQFAKCVKVLFCCDEYKQTLLSNLLEARRQSDQGIHCLQLKDFPVKHIHRC